mmetsp:Transcript_27712/g.92090  ORF Transcript_27712/g.92090 Transcript_27712/m.92090 type:complete len:323 (+) Transcript_27712:1220-2188(+)
MPEVGLRRQALPLEVRRLLRPKRPAARATAAAAHVAVAPVVGRRRGPGAFGRRAPHAWPSLEQALNGLIDDATSAASKAAAKQPPQRDDDGGAAVAELGDVLVAHGSVGPGPQPCVPPHQRAASRPHRALLRHLVEADEPADGRPPEAWNRVDRPLCLTSLVAGARAGRAAAALPKTSLAQGRRRCRGTRRRAELLELVQAGAPRHVDRRQVELQVPPQGADEPDDLEGFQAREGCLQVGHIHTCDALDNPRDRAGGHRRLSSAVCRAGLRHVRRGDANLVVRKGQLVARRRLLRCSVRRRVPEVAPVTARAPILSRAIHRR